MSPVTSAALRQLPKVSLHDHLDGGLRPQTVIDLCRENGHPLPTKDAEGLQEWIFQQCDAGNLVDYLKPFELTVGAMQTPEQLARVAHEFVLDMALDGVVYAETRWAPELHQQRGLGLSEAVLAVRDGLASGMSEAARLGTPVVARQLLVSMRHREPTVTIAQLTVDHRDDGVAGFDIAGAEEGFPPSRHRESFELLKRNNAHFTIHAGEAFGLPSIWEAVQLCGAERLGHGVRIVEDIDVTGDRPVLGPLAAYVRDRRIALELAPTSNLQTGIAATMAEHPIGLLFDLGFRVTVNCDNRLMSRTTMSDEFAAVAAAFGWGIDDVERCTISAMHSAFWDHQERERIISELVRPAYRLVRDEMGEL
ncbi:adenosine deaminase [Luteococcus sp. Sow4_B9]|uniref:adenosine deaminase n=1 Tax=Luteococcus sp. Sow4_B9 TaxID=3438792 RepID=UPI003F9A4FB4